MISVLILTKNEEKDLPACLLSVAWSDDIVVFDSHSSDATVAIAKAFGARVVQRHFDDWSSHQNWGLQNIEFRHPWVFYIDADERMSPQLVEGVRRVVAQPCRQVAFRILRRDYFLGTWLKHVQATSFYTRLFQPGRVRYERLVNPVTLVDGEVGDIEGYLDHYPFSKGIGHWLSRHNSYSSFEAQQIVMNRRNGKTVSVIKALASEDRSERRFHQKELFYRLPCRPALKFFLLFILKRGFLDGSAGLTYCLLQAIYEYMIVLKTRESEGAIVG